MSTPTNTNANTNTNTSGGAGSGMGGKLKGAYQVAHGVGETLRGSILGTADSSMNHTDGQAQNSTIASQGQAEYAEGMSRLRGTGGGYQPSNTTSGTAGTTNTTTANPTNATATNDFNNSPNAAPNTNNTDTGGFDVAGAGAGRGAGYGHGTGSIGSAGAGPTGDDGTGTGMGTGAGAGTGVSTGAGSGNTGTGPAAQTMSTQGVNAAQQGATGYGDASSAAEGGSGRMPGGGQQQNFDAGSRDPSTI